MKKTIQELKALWVTGYTPTQQDFADLFDSFTPVDQSSAWQFADVAEEETSVLFLTPLEIGTEFDLIFGQCVADGSPVAFTVSNISRTGFTVVAASVGKLPYQIQIS